MLLAAGTGVGHPGAWAKDWLSAEGVRGPKVLGLRPTHWRVEADPGVSARLRAGSAGSQSGCRSQGFQSVFQLTKGGVGGYYS